MEYQHTIQLYETVAVIMQQMLHAAKMEDWDKLIELEATCAQHVATLKKTENKQPLPSDALKRKLASMKSILADDREIRHLISPWMARLNALMNTTQTEKRLSQAYSQ